MKLKATLLTTSFLCVLVLPFRGMAQETTTKDADDVKAADAKKDEPSAPSPNYSGAFWTRSTLSGDWGGLRNDLAAKGVTLENARVGVTLALPVNRYNSVKLYGSTGVYSKLAAHSILWALSGNCAGVRGSSVVSVK